MKTELLQIASIPAIFLILGIYLFATFSQGFQDIVGILMIIVSIIGFCIGFGIHYFTKNYNKWYFNILKGFIGCISVFLILIIISRL